MIKDDKALTAGQFIDIMSKIANGHSFGKWYREKEIQIRCKHIKYVRPHFDMRDGKCFNVSFDDKTFDSGDAGGSMYERIMEWLNEVNT